MRAVPLRTLPLPRWLHKPHGWRDTACCISLLPRLCHPALPLRLPSRCARTSLPHTRTFDGLSACYRHLYRCMNYCACAYRLRHRKRRQPLPRRLPLLPCGLPSACVAYAPTTRAPLLHSGSTEHLCCVRPHRNTGAAATAHFNAACATAPSRAKHAHLRSAKRAPTYRRAFRAHPSARGGCQRHFFLLAH